MNFPRFRFQSFRVFPCLITQVLPIFLEFSLVWCLPIARPFCLFVGLLYWIICFCTSACFINKEIYYLRRPHAATHTHVSWQPLPVLGNTHSFQQCDGPRVPSTLSKHCPQCQVLANKKDSIVQHTYQGLWWLHIGRCVPATKLFQHATPLWELSEEEWAPPLAIRRDPACHPAAAVNDSATVF